MNVCTGYACMCMPGCLHARARVIGCDLVLSVYVCV